VRPLTAAQRARGAGMDPRHRGSSARGGGSQRGAVTAGDRSPPRSRRETVPSGTRRNLESEQTGTCRICGHVELVLCSSVFDDVKD